MQLQAWYNWLASTNRPHAGHILGGQEFEFTPFDELFAEDQPSALLTDDELAAEAAAKGTKQPD